jgi:predicted transglutaminase-like cysteine proteinase
MKYAIIALSILFSGCQIAPPAPFDYGAIVPAPEQCISWQARGGFCSLQHAVDEIHKRFRYVSDNDTYPEQRTFMNGYNADVWQLLPESGEGDCEDFALTLRWYLNSRGITGTHFLTIRVEGRGYHAALELNGWVMDNTSLFPRRRQDLPSSWAVETAMDESGVWRAVD